MQQLIMIISRFDETVLAKPASYTSTLKCMCQGMYTMYVLGSRINKNKNKNSCEFLIITYDTLNTNLIVFAYSCFVVVAAASPEFALQCE
jgi:hypothetical protein